MEEALLKKIDEISEEMISGIKRIVQIDSVQSEASRYAFWRRRK